MRHKHLHIGFDAKRAAQNKTGLGNYSRFIIRALSNYAPNLRLHLYVPNAKKTHSMNGVDKLVAVDIHFPKNRLWQSLRCLWRMRGAVSDMRERGIMLYHGLSGELPYGLHHAGIKSIVTIHDLIFLHFPKYYSFIDRLIYRWKFKSACRRADHIIAVSECTKRDIIHFFGTPEQKITVLYQGCDEIFRQSISDIHKDAVRRHYHLPERYILYVGSIEERKNLMLLAEALTILADREISVIALGHKTAYAKKVQSFVRKNNLSRRFRIISGVPSVDLPVFYQLSEAFVYPSRYEGFGIPLLEALCSGVPAIGCTGSCLEEAGGPSSLYVSPDDAGALAEAITKVLTDSHLREKMIADGYSYANHFTEERLILQLQNLYSLILANSIKR